MYIHKCFIVLQAWKGFVVQFVLILPRILDFHLAPYCIFTKHTHTTCTIWLMSSMPCSIISLPLVLLFCLSFPSCIATCSVLAGFPCELIFFPYFMLQKSSLNAIRTQESNSSRKHREIFRSPCTRIQSIISQNFTAIITSHQLFGPKSLINTSDCLPLHFCVYHPSRLAYFISVLLTYLFGH